MLSLQNYGSSTDSDSDTEKSDATKTSTETPMHLKSLNPDASVSKMISIQAAPEVVPVVCTVFI